MTQDYIIKAQTITEQAINDYRDGLIGLHVAYAMIRNAEKELLDNTEKRSVIRRLARTAIKSARLELRLAKQQRLFQSNTWAMAESEATRKGKLSAKTMNDVILRVSGEKRWDFFCDLVERYPMTKAALANGLKTAWDSGRPDYRAQELFNKVGLQPIMNAKEKRLFNSLPDIITIYRGCRKDEEKLHGEFLQSWTLRREVAEYFAFRDKEVGSNIDNKAVFSTEINKHDISALLLNRNEYEVVCFGISDEFGMDFVKMVTDKPTECYDIYREYAHDYFTKDTFLEWLNKKS